MACFVAWSIPGELKQSLTTMIILTFFNANAPKYIINYTISSVEDYSLNTKIYPNPTNKNITIESEYAIKSILLYNTIGNQLYSVNNNNNQQKEMTLDLSTFAKGIYFIKININNEIINERIILQ